jgi:hypothetical protein
MLYTKVCGNGTEHPRSWTTFTCFRIARNLEEIWSKIKSAREASNRVEHQLSDWNSMDMGEDHMVLFSKEHLKYSFSVAFKEWGCNGIVNQVPIVWFTRPSGLNASIGSYCICSISPHRIRGIVPLNDGMRHGILDTRCEVTKDVFWTKLNSACGMFGISQLIVHRVLAHFVIHQYNGGVQLNPTKTTLVDHMENIPLGDNFLELLFSPRQSAQDHVNNHVCKVVKAKLAFYDHTLATGYALVNGGNRRGSTLELTNLAFRGMSPQYLRSVLLIRTTNDHVPPVDQISFPFYDSDTPQVTHLNALTDQPGYSNLYKAIRYACQRGVLTDSLLRKILEFRLLFNRNRELFQQGELATANYDLSELNTTLLVNAGFSGIQATMQLKSVR